MTSVELEDDDGLNRVRYPERRLKLLKILETIGEYHVVDDPSTYVFTTAVAVSNWLEGSPLWGMVIGPASGGKTEALAIVKHAVKQEVDDFTVPALLSWHKPTQNSPSKRAGILVRVGERGVLSVGDFSTVLSDSQRGRREQLFSALRRIFDGRYQRDLGNENESLVWEGRVTILAACTSAIDNFASHSDSLGPRWVYFRLPPRDSKTRRNVTSRAVRAVSADVAERRAKAQELVEHLIHESWESAEQLELPENLLRAVEEAAQVVCYGRASVPRDSSPRREVIGLPDMEEPPRVAKQLVMLLRCLLVIGLSDGEALGIVSRVAMDSMPAVRALALGAIAAADRPVTTAAIAKLASADWKVVNRALEDFEVIGLVSHQVGEPTFEAAAGAAQSKPWVLDHEDAGIIRTVMERRTYRVLAELGG